MGKTKTIKKEAVVEVKEKKLSSYTARLIHNDKGMQIDVPIRWKKLDAGSVDKEVVIIYRDADGNLVKSMSYTEDGKIIEPAYQKDNPFITSDNKVSQKKGYFKADGTLVLEGIQAYQVIDCKELAVEKNKKTEDFVILSSKPIAEKSDWLVDDIIAIWGEEPQDQYSLSKFAKYLYDNKIMAIIKFSTPNSWGKNYGLITARFYDKETNKTLETPVAGCGVGITMVKTTKKMKFDAFGGMTYTTVAPKISPKETNTAAVQTKMDSME